MPVTTVLVQLLTIQIISVIQNTDGSRHGSAVSYAVSVENINIQADVLMNNGKGAQAVAAKTAHGNADDDHGDGFVEGAKAVPEDKNVDEFHLGISMGLGENGKIGFAHISHDMKAGVAKKSNFIAAQYTIGSMTAYLGVAQHKSTNSNVIDRTGTPPATADDNKELVISQNDSTTFAGIRGSVGDTGLNYLFQARSKKSKGNKEVWASTDILNAERAMPAAIDANKHTPWMMGLYRSLGGGATVMFEHGNPDKTDEKSTSHLALKVDF